ncbi:hypothetical protein EVAR_98497_1 [Eumeta japonica]|uniref:DUF5641 domain-containing protein n=1 Tax=Eumeta variegata TaxID=151549 RepID=A0A4C2AB37_EUMVA|nr:hypothetical protein EVAR_98497_1 [Eumeta japonica]
MIKHARGTREDEERSRRPHHNLEVHTGAPNMGGAWALVRSIKTAPLTEVDVEPAEASRLHLLIGRSCGAAAAGHFDDNVLHGPANWRTCQRLADHFWQRWLRVLWCPAGRSDPICRAPAEGDIVLIVDSSSPRYSWPRGRIKKTYPGPDNQIRVVDVETGRSAASHFDRRAGVS